VYLLWKRTTLEAPVQPKRAVCHTCKKQGHFSPQCFAKKLVADISALEEQSQEYYATLFLDTVDTGGNHNVWNITIQLEGKDMCFKHDAGAEVSAVGENILHSLNVKRL